MKVVVKAQVQGLFENQAGVKPFATLALGEIKGL